MLNLPHDFKNRIEKRWGDSSEFFASYENAPQRAIRVNTLKISVDDFKKISPFVLESVPWEKNGFYVDGDKLGKTALHSAGAYYVQEPSAMSAVPLLDVKKGERVLDMCSAPGGKGTQCAQALDGEGIVVLNEIIFSRAKILSQNVERLGVKNAVVTCASPAEIAKNFANYFDKIIVDAPCSGEGMFKKEQSAIDEWSEQNVSLCATRQKEILECASIALKVGGKMVYSTCTFAEEEDEWQIETFLKNHPEFTLIKAEKLLPHKVRGEGHFCALLQKNGEITGDEQTPTLKATFSDKKLIAEYKSFEKQTLFVEFGNLHLVGDTLYSLPDQTPKTSLQTLRAGVRLGTFTKGRFQPDQSLASCLKKGECKHITLNENQTLSYLAGNTISCDDELKGWYVIFFDDLSVGWGKAVQGTLKNHYPKGLRINK